MVALQNTDNQDNKTKNHDLNVVTNGEAIQPAEIPSLEPREINLHFAYAFRVQLDTPSQQAEVINGLRDPKNGEKIIAFPEGHNTILGFFWSDRQLARLKDVCSPLKGTIAIGESMGESHITTISDRNGDHGIIAACEATILAQRALNTTRGGNSTATSLSDLRGAVYAYRYYVSSTNQHLQRSETSSERDERLLPILQENQNLVLAKNGALLEKVKVTFSDNKFSKEVTSIMEQDLETLPDTILKPDYEGNEIDILLRGKIGLTIVNIDVNNFSKTYHKKTLQMMTALQRNPKEALRLEQELREFRLQIATFFATFQRTASDLITQAIEQDTTIDADVATQMIRSTEWKGDAGGLIIPTQYVELIQRAIKMTHVSFPDLSFKASIRRYDEVLLKQKPGQLTRVPRNVEETDELLARTIEDLGIQKEDRSGIVVEYDKDGNLIEVSIHTITLNNLIKQTTIRPR